MLGHAVMNLYMHIELFTLFNKKIKFTCDCSSESLTRTLSHPKDRVLRSTLTALEVAMHHPSSTWMTQMWLNSGTWYSFSSTEKVTGRCHHSQNNMLTQVAESPFSPHYISSPHTSHRCCTHMYICIGMGFERLVSVLQNKPSNYDTDVFMPIMNDICTKLKISPYKGRINKYDEGLKVNQESLYIQKSRFL